MRARGSSDDVFEQLGCTLTPCGIELPPDLTFEEWLTALREQGKQRDTAFWRIGVLWVYGEHRYGERKALIESDDWKDLVGVAYSTCTHAATVVRAFPESCRRRQLLTPSHHIEVAHLPPKRADELLDWAEEPLARGGQRRSVRALREEINRRLERIPTRPFGSIEPATLAVTLAIAPEPESSEYVVLPLPASPRHESEVRQLLGEPEPPADVTPRPAEPLDQFKAFLRYTEARLPADASPAVLLAAIDQTKLLLARLTKRLRQSGGDQGDKVVVNLR
jgi:hypothetical protein